MSEPEITDDEVRRLLKLRLATANPRVAMVAFIRGNPSSPQGADDNGTASLLELPTGKYLVTNHHVWDTFQTLRDSDPTYRLALHGQGLSRPIDISDAEMVSESRDRDLCVLSYPAERIESIGNKFFAPAHWPPPRTQVGDDVAVVGYPGMRRTAETLLHPQLGMDVPILRHESVILYLRTESVSSRQGRLCFQTTTPEVISLSERPLDRFRWGGMSGSLVYRKPRSQEHFVPCGILSAAGEGLDAIFYCTHLDFIAPDGRIVES